MLDLGRPALTAPPSDETARRAGEASALLQRLAGKRPEHCVHFDQDGTEADGLTVVLPDEALRLLITICEELKAGNSIAVIPRHAELTTQQAADFLNVSRPFLVRQLDEGRIPFRKVGTHRRVRFADILTYKQKSEQIRQQALTELVAESEELGLYR